MSSHDEELRARADALTRALAVGGDRVDPATAGQVHDAVAGVRKRLALGVDHTVVALVGGTGSGKSSLFNQISRLDFADVGVKRPTTARLTACSWSDDATALLDWIGIDVDRRITRDQLLDGRDDSALAGLVLLDLPDHDSIEPAHRVLVDRVLPMVDLLVWVVDPQKYADDALHSGYLQKSAGLEGSMIVALNQLDTVPVTQREALGQDMERLLEADGLSGMVVVMVSAKTGEGLYELRSLLEEAVDRRSVAASRVAGELDRAGALLLAQTPAPAPWDSAAAAAGQTQQIAEAFGVGSVAKHVASAVRSGWGRPTWVEPNTQAVALARSQWITRAGFGLRDGWQRALDHDVATAQRVVANTQDALAQVCLDVTGPRSVRTWRVLAWVSFGVAGLAAVAVVLGLLEAVDFTSTVMAALFAVFGVGVLVAGVCLTVGQVRRRSLARRREQRVREDAVAAIAAVVSAAMVAPTAALLAAHQSIHDMANSARDFVPTAPLTGAFRLPTGQHFAVPSTDGVPEPHTATANRAP